MKKFFTLMLVVFVSIAIFAADEESASVEATTAVVEEEVVEDKLVDISGTVGFDLMIDEAGLDLATDFSPEIIFETEVAGGTFEAEFGPSVTTELYVADSTGSTPVSWDSDAEEYYYYDDFGKKISFDPADVTVSKVVPSVTSFSLTSVKFDTDSWSLTAAPEVVGLSTYTIGSLATAEAALQLELKDYGLKVELVDAYAYKYTDEVTPHATGTFAVPLYWHVGAMYDFDVSGVAGSVAGAYKVDYDSDDATNNRITVEGQVTEVPVPGSLTADVAFGLLNYDDTTIDSTSAYRVHVAYEYPLEIEPVTVTPHVAFTWQNNLKKVYADEYGNDLMALFGVPSAFAKWVDTQAIEGGVDVSYTATPVTVNLEDTLTVDLSDTELAFSVAPHLNVAVDVTDQVALSVDGYYFYDSVDEIENPIAYMVDASYAINDYLKAGVHAGNETWHKFFGAPVEIKGADPLTDLHWNLYLSGELEF